MSKLPKKRYFTVIGRIPHDDEDSCYIIRTTARGRAMARFEKRIYKDAGRKKPKPGDADYEGESAVFINHILVTDTKPDYEGC